MEAEVGTRSAAEPTSRPMGRATAPMPLLYSSTAIANYFIEKARTSGCPDLSPMKLQKLVYYAHGWHLGLTGQPLLDEQVQCWKFGPVVESLYHATKHFGMGVVTARLAGPPDDPTAANPPHDQRVRHLLDKIWDTYSGFTAIQLSNLTHLPGEPWRDVYDQHNGLVPLGIDIPDELIRRHFAKLAAQNSQRAHD